MNKTYRVIFSKARGALMVVNELTSCVQKKGASAIVTAAALSLTSTVLMAATTPEANEGQTGDITIVAPDKNAYAVEAKAGQTQTYGDSESTVTISATGSGGIAAYSAGDLTIQGKSIELTSKKDAARATSGGKLTIGTDQTQNVVLNAEKYGVFANKNATEVNLKGKTIGLATKSEAVYIKDGAHASIGSDKTDSLTIVGTRGLHATNSASITVTGNQIDITSTTMEGIAAEQGGDVTVGGDHSATVLKSTINNKDNTGAITATENASKVLVNGSSLRIEANTTKGKVIGGLWAQNNTQDETAPQDTSTITINAADTYISVTSDTNLAKDKKAGSIGIVAMSNGKVDVTGNLTVEAEDAILVRGYSTVLINQTGDKTVKLTGNVDFNYDAVTSGTVVDATAKIKLTNGDSFWTGRVLATNDAEGEVDLPSKNPNFQIGSKAEGLVLELANGGTWNITGNSFREFL